MEHLMRDALQVRSQGGLLLCWGKRWQCILAKTVTWSSQASALPGHWCRLQRGALQTLVQAALPLLQARPAPASSSQTAAAALSAQPMFGRPCTACWAGRMSLCSRWQQRCSVTSDEQAEVNALSQGSKSTAGQPPLNVQRLQYLNSVASHCWVSWLACPHPPLNSNPRFVWCHLQCNCLVPPSAAQPLEMLPPVTCTDLS